MSSVSSTSSTAASSKLRITGQASGLDVDATVKKLMDAENQKLIKLNQNRQYTQWRQDGLRDIIKDVRDLRQNYLLYESPADTNMIKGAAYSGAVVTAVDSDSTTGAASSALTATALPGAANGTSTIKVTQMAKSAKIAGSSLNSVALGSPDGSIVSNDWAGKVLTFSIKNANGTSTAYDTGAIAAFVDTGNTSSDAANLATAVNDAINSNTNLKGKVAATVSADGNISFNVLSSDSIKLTGEVEGPSGAPTSQPKLAGLIGKELNSSTSTKLSDLGVATDLSFTITQSGKTSSVITVKSDQTVQDLISAINSAQAQNGISSSGALYANLQVGFSELTKSLTIQTRDTGSSQSLKITPISGDITKLGLSTTETQKSQDAIVEITPAGSSTSTTVTKSSNSFTIDNMSYNILKDPSTVTAKSYTVNLTTKPDATDAVKKIKAFVDKYNTLVDKIYTKTTEKKEYNYKPLTDDQKSSMTEAQIKTWEDKAKTGILKNDGDLQDMLTNFRSAFMDSVKSAGISLEEIGIQTYSSFEAISKPGQLKVDETKLKTALENRGDQVMKLFAATPDKSITDKKEIYNNTGIFQRVEDIINDSAVKFDGTLLKKAGFTGTLSDTTNSITLDLKEQDTAIYNMKKKLADKEEAYYQKFSKLETAMTKLNAQQEQLSKQLGTS